MNPLLVPGAMVRHPTQPDWGLGQVQSVVGERAYELRLPVFEGHF